VNCAAPTNAFGGGPNVSFESGAEIFRRTIEGFGTLTINQTIVCDSGTESAPVMLQPVDVTYGPPCARLMVFVMTGEPAVPDPPLIGGLPSTFRLLLYRTNSNRLFVLGQVPNVRPFDILAPTKKFG
jgi:hypothetical protein